MSVAGGALGRMTCLQMCQLDVMIRHTFLGPVTLAKRQRGKIAPLCSGSNAWLPKRITWELLPRREKELHRRIKDSAEQSVPKWGTSLPQA